MRPSNALLSQLPHPHGIKVFDRYSDGYLHLLSPSSDQAAFPSSTGRQDGDHKPADANFRRFCFFCARIPLHEPSPWRSADLETLPRVSFSAPPHQNALSILGLSFRLLWSNSTQTIFTSTLCRRGVSHEGGFTQNRTPTPWRQELNQRRE